MTLILRTSRLIKFFVKHVHIRRMNISHHSNLSLHKSSPAVRLASLLSTFSHACLAIDHKSLYVRRTYGTLLTCDILPGTTSLHPANCRTESFVPRHFTTSTSSLSIRQTASVSSSHVDDRSRVLHPHFPRQLQLHHPPVRCCRVWNSQVSPFLKLCRIFDRCHQIRIHRRCLTRKGMRVSVLPPRMEGREGAAGICH